MNKILVIVGPTSSGKSELAVRLARRFNGEIISCDSRQIYKGMDLGTGKILGRWRRWKKLPAKWSASVFRGRGKRLQSLQYAYAYKGIIHHLIDFAPPRSRFSAAQFKILAQKTITDIIARGKLPILCGGTMHWMDAVVFDQNIPDVKPNFKLRARLEKKNVDELYHQLKKLDANRAATIDPHNKRRLIRALEIAITSGKPVPIFKSLNLQSLDYQPLWLGISVPQKILYQKIGKRLKLRIKAGMIAEVARLHQFSPPQNLGRVPRRGRRGLSWRRLESFGLLSFPPLPARHSFSEGGARGGLGRGRTVDKYPRGLSWKHLESFGLEYKYISLYIQGKLPRDEMITKLSYAIKHYAKRQMTWWKKNKQIRWIDDKTRANKIVSKFLNLQS